MNGRDLTLGLVGALAVWAALGRRGSRATDPTSTEAFRRWFGESKVVDGAGRPLVVYHATRTSFDAFKPGGTNAALSGPAMWFTDARESQPAAHNLPGEAPEGWQVLPVYLRMENPLVIASPSEHQLAKRMAVGYDTDKLARAGAFPLALTRSMVARIRADDYDGIVYDRPAYQPSAPPPHNDEAYRGWRGKPASWRREFIVFDPTQIKSATGNRGTFDPADPRISFNRAPTDAALRTLRAAMVKAARADTAYDPAKWKRAKDPLTGHCYAAAHLVQDRFGGELVKGTVRGQAHAWNRLPGGREVDLTGSQYGGDGMHPLVQAEGVAASRSTNPRFARFAERVDAQLARR